MTKNEIEGDFDREINEPREKGVLVFLFECFVLVRGFNYFSACSLAVER
jgi:hypothetical protein